MFRQALTCLVGIRFTRIGLDVSSILCDLSLFASQLRWYFSARLDTHIIECILESKQKGSRYNALGEFRYNALVESTPSFLCHNSLEAMHDALSRFLLTCHMHPALYRNIWVRDACRQ